MTKDVAIIDPIAQASDFVDLCEIFGYTAEEHVVHTEDGYLLGIHRLAWRKGEEDKRVNSGHNSIQKPCVYLHHGLMMNSEVWVCLSEKERSLPFVLVEKGYDVWLGNNRGNKYSKKSTHHSPNSTAFWSFSLDEFAFYDIPSSIWYILSTAEKESLSYIGFSQGTAQAFAMLSVHPRLNDKVDVFIALAPAMSPPGLANGIVASLVKTSPEFLYLAFGRRSILSSATLWQEILYPPIFIRTIDIGLRFLFGWHTENISVHQKMAAYPHLYSFTSTKSVVHWFQIIRNGTFQMFDDEVQGPLNVSEGRRYYKVPKFPTRNIKTPIVLLYGGSDSLVDINIMLRELPNHTVATEVPPYEHLDFLWASDVDKRVFPHVFDALEFHGREKSLKSKDASVRVERLTSTSIEPPTYSEDERGHPNTKKRARMDGSNSLDTPSSSRSNADSTYALAARPSSSEDAGDPDSPVPNSAFSSARLRQVKARSRTSSLDSQGSAGAGSMSGETRIGAGGISLGASKAAGGVVDKEASGPGIVDGSKKNSSPQEKGKKKNKKK